MAIYSRSSSNTWFLSVKMVLISTGVVSMAVMLKLSVPIVTDFVASEVPSIWRFVLSWLTPPYLYLVINCIILSIVASSKLQQKSVDERPLPSELLVTPVTAATETVKMIASESRTDFPLYEGTVLDPYGSYDENNVVKLVNNQVVETDGLYGRIGVVYDGVRVSEAEMEKQNNRILMEKQSNQIVMDGDGDGGDEAVVSSKRWNDLQRMDSSESMFSNGNEKPPVSSRFSHRKTVKSSPENGGKALRVSKPKRNDTLESTWKMITDGRSIPLTRHLKKSDTWDSHIRKNAKMDDQNTPPSKTMKKSETLHDRTSDSGNSSLSQSPGSGKFRREPSLSQDELNKRVEAFIKKFNEDMRLQRQESLNQYQDMVNRRAH